MVMVSNSTFYSNSGYEGGGIYNRYGTMIVRNTTFSDNTGGGIYNFFRVDRNSMMDAVSNALSNRQARRGRRRPGAGLRLGRDGVAAFRTALAKTGAKLVHEEYAPPTATDFTAPAHASSTRWPRRAARNTSSPSGPAPTRWASSRR